MSTARAIADVTDGVIVATIDIRVPPERVFRALTSEEIIQWWVRPGVFDTREWVGDVRVGGRWRASGIGNGKPYTLEGEFTEVDPPRKLVHTWSPVGPALPPSIVTYTLEQIEGGTRLTLRHSGIVAPAMFENTSVGWEVSLETLVELLSAEAA
ncbi:SRPBCC family protein [Roseiarcaceae bacterium H3SJ34-1]|uniref:SRPBCC family protein n=1 Tax=Terripilifer ovatus TaxID=3032367 RepID=UPI003AB9526B|nr:SRPBCC family protein [Roseiarcaceae bacterium H3SJ34-1]